MSVFLIVIALILLFIGAFLFVHSEFGLEIIKTEAKSDIFIRFNILKIPFKIPLKQKKAKKKAPKKDAKKEEKLSFGNFKENVTALKEIYDSQKSNLRQMLSYTRRHISIKSVDFNIHFGFDNAATTGISTGAIWGMGSFILKVIDSLIGIKKINMQVNPDFDKKTFEIYSKTILIIRPIHFIIIVGQVLKTIEFVNNKINNINKGRV